MPHLKVSNIFIINSISEGVTMQLFVMCRNAYADFFFKSAVTVAIFGILS
jgi:hypothetical protein